MTFPQAPNFRSAVAGSAWFWWIAAPDKGLLNFFVPSKTDRFIGQTQWPTIVRRAQTVLKQIFFSHSHNTALNSGQKLEFGFTYFNPQDGSCRHGATLDVDIPSLEQTAIKPSQLVANGKWTVETASLLGFFLCHTGNTQAAKALGQDMMKRTIGAETVRFMIWIAFFLNPNEVSLIGDQSKMIPESAKLRGQGIVLATNTILPLWDVNPEEISAEEDRYVLSEAGAPIPSVARGDNKLTPWPANAPVPPVYPFELPQPPVPTQPTQPTQPTPASAMPQSSGTATLLALAGLGVGAWLLFGGET